MRRRDWYWVAGFLEGDGTFARWGVTRRIVAVQVEKEPIARLQQWCGGVITHHERPDPRHAAFDRWVLHGEEAVAVMGRLFAVLSPARQRQIVRVVGSRPPHRYALLPPTTLRDRLAWTAGFLEAEGHIASAGGKGRPRFPVVSATQVQAEPVQWLKAWWGGTLRLYSQKNERHSDFYRWQLGTAHGRALLMMLYAWMSPKRQRRIASVLHTWKTYVPGKPHNTLKTQCPQGHALSGDNLYLYPDGRRSCLVCAREASKLYQRARRERLRLQE